MDRQKIPNEASPAEDTKECRVNWIQNRLNHLSDLDWGWWPFLRIRPERNQAMSWSCLALMSIVYRTLAAALATIFFPAISAIASPRTIAILAGSIAALLLGSATAFRWAWNARASSLNELGKPRSEASDSREVESSNRERRD